MITFSCLGLTQDEQTVTCHPPKLLFWLSLEVIFFWGLLPAYSWDWLQLERLEI